MKKEEIIVFVIILVLLLLLLPIPAYYKNWCSEPQMIKAPGYEPAAPKDCGGHISTFLPIHLLYEIYRDLEHNSPFDYFDYYNIEKVYFIPWIIAVIGLSFLLTWAYFKIREVKLRRK